MAMSRTVFLQEGKDDATTRTIRHCFAWKLAKEQADLLPRGVKGQGHMGQVGTKENSQQCKVQEKASTWALSVCQLLRSN